ncbi:MAG: hypothetical protein EBY21_02525 [Alphaproteobacteria bacterium]|nr:hypothetical protein [Alphaproteobacteria bacterium]
MDCAVSYQLSELRRMGSSARPAPALSLGRAGTLFGYGLGLVVLMGSASLLTYKLGQSSPSQLMAKSKSETQLDHLPAAGQPSLVAGTAQNSKSQFSKTQISTSDVTGSIAPHPSHQNVRSVGSPYSPAPPVKLQNQAQLIHKLPPTPQAKADEQPKTQVQASTPPKSKVPRAETTSTKGLSPIRPLPKIADTYDWDQR